MIDVNGGELLFRPLDTVEYKITITTAIDGAQQFTSEVHQQNEYREGMLYIIFFVLHLFVFFVWKQRI